MAKGISNRMHLNLPMFRRATADIAAVEQRVDESLRNIARWANSLPFAATGFDFWRSTNEAATSASTERVITWTNVIDDREGFMPASGSTQSITVPRELSGLYIFRFTLWFGGAVTGQLPFIRVNGNAITNAPNYSTTEYMHSTIALQLLQDGDVITAGHRNDSGGSVTVTAFGGASLDAPVPRLQAWRIALLA